MVLQGAVARPLEATRQPDRSIVLQRLVPECDPHAIGTDEEARAHSKATTGQHRHVLHAWDNQRCRRMHQQQDHVDQAPRWRISQPRELQESDLLLLRWIGSLPTVMPDGLKIPGGWGLATNENRQPLVHPSLARSQHRFRCSRSTNTVDSTCS